MFIGVKHIDASDRIHFNIYKKLCDIYTIFFPDFLKIC